MATPSTSISLDTPLDAELLNAIRELDNNSLIVRLGNTVNHLSRWLTPIHDRNKLERSRYHGEPSVKELLLGMREYEQFVYPRMNMIAVHDDPDLDAVPMYVPSETTRLADRERSTVELMGSYRRLRQGTCGLLRQLPDDAWGRVGHSRKHANMSLRALGEDLLAHDYRYLQAMDGTLNVTGAREGIAEIQRTPFRQLIRLSPSELKL